MSIVHWVALSIGARLGRQTIARLIAHCGSLEAIFTATPETLRQVKGVGPKTSAAIVAIRLDQVEALLAEVAAQGVHAIACEDKGYPANLKQIDDPPPALFMRGSILPVDARAVAIVGTRDPSRRGEELAYTLGYELARRGWTIVSGLALGIDMLAHQGALDAGGRTLAVLGGGLLNIYPPNNQSLADKIAGAGALLSETHPRASVSPQTLMARNRVTSGLSRAVIVVEAHADSGSVSTARRAWAQGRGVFAASGGDDAGCAALLRDGAAAISDWDNGDNLSERLERDGKQPPHVTRS